VCVCVCVCVCARARVDRKRFCNQRHAYDARDCNAYRECLRPYPTVRVLMALRPESRRIYINDENRTVDRLTTAIGTEPFRRMLFALLCALASWLIRSFLLFLFFRSTSDRMLNGFKDCVQFADNRARMEIESCVG
jgi:hypothetical protein